MVGDAPAGAALIRYSPLPPRPYDSERDYEDTDYDAMTLLNKGEVATRLPAQDLDRARRFYEEKLGLKPVEERPGGLLCRYGSGYFALFQSTGRPSGIHTQMAWSVADLAATVAELRAHGIGQPTR